VQAALEPFVAGAASKRGTATENYLFGRILVTIINEAAHAFDEGVASADDINTAMRLGTSYPHGPLEWAARIGRDRCARLLEGLDATVTDDRFRLARWLSQS
jgi:3-hydroxybutyryl-CoA dehydrogenase